MPRRKSGKNFTHFVSQTISGSQCIAPEYYSSESKACVLPGISTVVVHEAASTSVTSTVISTPATSTVTITRLSTTTPATSTITDLATAFTGRADCAYYRVVSKHSRVSPRVSLAQIADTADAASDRPSLLTAVPINSFLDYEKSEFDEISSDDPFNSALQRPSLRPALRLLRSWRPPSRLRLSSAPPKPLSFRLRLLSL